MRVATYLDMAMIEDPQRGVAIIMQIKNSGSNLIGLEYGNMNWYWTGGRKLVGLSLDRKSFKIIDEIKFNDKPEPEHPYYSVLFSEGRKDFKFKEEEKPSEPKTKGINFTNIIAQTKSEESPKKQAHSCSNLEI